MHDRLDAIEHVVVDIEPLGVVTCAESGCVDDASQLHADLDFNVLASMPVAKVDVAKALVEAQIRVIAPDVGGGFGVKGHVC